MGIIISYLLIWNLSGRSFEVLPEQRANILSAQTVRVQDIIASSFTSPTPTPTTTPSTTPTPTPVVMPSSLNIPRLNIVNASFEYTGVSGTGQMETPVTYDRPGWLHIGPAPGQAGTAVVSGHYDDPTGSPAIFYYLKYLQPGDAIYTTMANGTTREFVVEGLYELDATQNSVEYIIAQTKGASLNLVTCHGAWYGGHVGYSKRLLVRANLK